MTNNDSQAPVGAKVMFNNKAYDVAKFIALVALPALAVLYAAIGTIFEIPKTTEVVAAITAVDLFLGTLLGISTSQFKRSDANKDGVLVVNKEDPNKDSYSFEVTKPLEDIEQQDTITLKVRRDS